MVRCDTCGTYMWHSECEICLGHGEIDMSDFQDDCPMPEDYCIEVCGECGGDGGVWICPDCEPERAKGVFVL